MNQFVVLCSIHEHPWFKMFSTKCIIHVQFRWCLYIQISRTAINNPLFTHARKKKQYNCKHTMV